ncbi:MAG: TIGR03936 family radical SAM-associated protein [Firmicutes bacterium]|nr:TIGR03936 family radical SAM-associated protein [Bacillota bacterium]
MNPRWRLRLCLSRTGRVRFISHLDFVRLFERAVRRAGLPVVLSEGYSPAPRIAYGWPLPLGMEALSEYVDVELTARVPPDDASARLARALPEGFAVRDARYVNPHGPSLMAEFDTAVYIIRLPGREKDLGEWREAAHRLLASPRLEVVRERGPAGVRETKRLDLRPFIRRLEVRGEAPGGRVEVLAELALGDGGTARPEEVAALLAAGVQGEVPSGERPEGLETVRVGFRRAASRPGGPVKGGGPERFEG